MTVSIVKDIKSEKMDLRRASVKTDEGTDALESRGSNPHLKFSG